MDLDDSGSIDADELGLILKSFGEAVPPARLKSLIREVRRMGPTVYLDIRNGHAYCVFVERRVGTGATSGKRRTAIVCCTFRRMC